MKQPLPLMLVASLSACGHSPEPPVNTDFDRTSSPTAQATEQPAAAPSPAVRQEPVAAAPVAQAAAPPAAAPGPEQEAAPPAAEGSQPPPAAAAVQEPSAETAPAETVPKASPAQQAQDISPWDAKDRATDLEAGKARYQYSKARFDRWRFKGQCQKRQLKEYAYHMPTEHCFRQAQQLDGGVAHITARFAAHSHELSVQAEIPALPKSKTRKELAACVRKAVESSGAYWGGSRRPANWDKNDRKLVCTLRYRITQSYERTNQARDRRDQPRRVRDPAAYQLKTHDIKVTPPCKAEALPAVIESTFDTMKECLALAGNGLFGRHQLTFYLNDGGGMSTSPQSGRSNHDRRDLRKVYRRKMKEGQRRCLKAADRKACRDALKIQLRKWRLDQKRKQGGSSTTFNEKSSSENRSKAQGVISRCVTSKLSNARYRKVIGAGLDHRQIPGRRGRTGGSRNYRPKSVCEVNWVLEHSRRHAP